MIHPDIAQDMPNIIAILKNNHVKKAYLFGSAVTDNFNVDSDIDILVTIDDTLDVMEYGRSYWNILFGLEDELHREIDLLTIESLSNPYFINEVNTTKVEIL